jgi:hypothetical protein
MNDDSKGNYAAVNGLDLYYESHGDGEPLISPSCLAGRIKTSSALQRWLPSSRLSWTHQSHKESEARIEDGRNDDWGSAPAETSNL